jgi:polysaccharide biosynthesis/export protein
MNRTLGVLIATLLLAPAIRAAQSDYLIGPNDVLSITVYDQADLTGRVKVDADGTLTFPLIGRVKAGGSTLRALEIELTTRLADGFLRNPQVSVSMDEFRSQRIFVMGEVRAPGTYQLEGEMTIIEVLSRAGGIVQGAADEVLIVRPSRPGADRAVGPEDDSDATVVRVNIRELQAGSMSQNVALRHGDTLVVPRAQLVYVFGQVRAPGAYGVEKGMTVLQALSLAGGVTDRGSTSRMKVVRAVDGKKKELKVKLTDVVEPGDTLIVAERFF